ncbi:MAG TPA: VOC family protein [Allosphingosinicella sp.]|jgi:catechol 2,3-dioxygenase-like lactoylglutathione lyase family enzyme
MAKPVKFAHVVYMTRRFDEMIAWYCNVFEAEVVYANPALAFLTYDEEHHRFAFANLELLKPDAPGAGERADIGVNHVAYTYANVAGEDEDSLIAFPVGPPSPIPAAHGMT